MPIFPKWEKIVLLFLIITAITASSILGYKRYINTTNLMPAEGGEYREGIIADSISDVRPVIRKLTNIGLVRFDKLGEIKPDLAERWEISEDQKTYTFYLKKEIIAQDLVDIIHNEKPSWSDIEIETPEENTIIFKLKQAFAPLLANLSDPIFPYGPFEIQKKTKSEIILISRNDKVFHKPYLKKIILKLYPDYDNLIKALKGKQLDGVSYIEDQADLPKIFNYYEIKLPRYLILFFNLNSPIWEDKIIRQKLTKSEAIDEEITAVLATSTKQINLSKAEEIKNNWQDLKVNVDIRSYDPHELQSEIIPKRQYDLLLYGLDYGCDPDLYPFWHSSQITESGLNLSNFSDVDADKLLEQARLITNQEERNKKYEEFQNIFADIVPAIVLEQDICRYAISDKIKGITVDFQAHSPADRFYDMEKWYIKEKRVKK